MTDETTPDDTTPAASAGPAESAASAESPEGAADAAAARREAMATVEAMLYAAGKAVAVEKLVEASELAETAVRAALDDLAEDLDRPGRGVKLDRVGDGVRLVSRLDYDYPIRRLLGLDGKTKLSMAALESLAIIAYRQPITAPEVSELRGVNSSSSIRTLLDRKLVTTAGRKEVVGTPFLYKTTKEFLVHFGLTGLGELPKPEELEAIYGIEPAVPEAQQTELFPGEEPAADAPPEAFAEADGAARPDAVAADEPTPSPGPEVEG